MRVVSAYPFDALRRLSRTSAALESVVARWAIARPVGARLAKLIGAPARVRVLGVVEGATSGSSMSGSSFDPFAALAEVRIHGQSFVVGASSAFVRELAQKRLYGPEELGAPRPLSIAEHALFAGFVAAAIVDATIPGEVWPVADADGVHATLHAPMSRAPSTSPSPPSPSPSPSRFVIDLALDIEGRAAPVTIRVWCPASMRVALPPPRPLPAWDLDIPVVVGACALHRDDVSRLQLRDVVTIERSLSLRVGDRAIALVATPGAVEAKVASDYVRRDMALPDDAHLELTVQLGTTRLSLRQLSDLVPGSIVPLGRPLSGPFEVRAAGRLVGQGELVDVDGELGVRIVSLQE